MTARAFCLCTVAMLTACSGGRDKLLADLQSARPEERALAVKKLAEQHHADDLVLFTQAARDPVAIVRAEAIEALGSSEDPRVVDLLGDLLSDDDDQVQTRAAKALAQVGNDKARSYLMLQYGRRGRNTRQAIVQALTATNVPGAMASVVAAEAKAIWERNLQTLQNGTPPERVGAAEELGKSGRPEAVNRLVPLLKDGQVMLAAAAVRGLGNAGDRRAVQAISELLTESYPQLREAACEALIQLKDPQALPRLMEVASERSPASPLAVAAIVALPHSPEADKALCTVALQGAAAEAVEAGREMRRRNGCPLEPILDKLRNASTQTAALQALAALGPSAHDALPKVLPLLTTSDPTVRKLAVEAVIELADRSAAPQVLKAYEAEVKALEAQRSDWVSAPLPEKFGAGFDPAAPVDPNDPAAAMKLKQVDLFRRVQQLNEARLRESNRTPLTQKPPRELVDDASEEQLKVLASLVHALGALQVENARALVEPYAQESSPSLRAAAYVALAGLGGDALKVAQPGLLDSERTVQAATAEAFAVAGEPGQSLLLETLAQLNGDRSRLLEPLKDATLTKAAVPTLLQLVKEGDAEAGTAAVMLGRIKAPEAVEPLMKALGDPTAVARREMLVALGLLGDAKARDLVAKDLYSDRSEVRAAAAEALLPLGRGNHSDALLALKVDYYRKVREAAMLALGQKPEKAEQTEPAP
ncbi:MAG: HEAT repeat domain-containing protein [Archangiaceae bacterium]|nr:HEAT repeat domain-containing protein [Archangiaceae bacterium]